MSSAGSYGSGGSGMSGVLTITGDFGPSVTGNVLLTGGSSGGIFTGTAPSTMTMSFNFLDLPATDNPLTEGYISFNGNPTLALYGGNTNIFLGVAAGNVAQSGTSNVAIGQAALAADTNSNGTVAIGYFALENIANSQFNTAVGGNSMALTTNSDRNTAIGNQALSLLSSTGGDGNNTALGYISLGALDTGLYNTAIGSRAGANYTGSESDNICIGSEGTLGDNHQIRIGTQGVGLGEQDLCNIAGIYGSTVGGTNAAVFIDNAGNLGTIGGTASGVTSITGDAGGAVSGAVTLTGGTSGIVFTGSLGTTLTVTSLGTTNHQVQVGNASNTLTGLTVGTNGQVLIGSTAANPVFATLTSTGSSITYTTGAGTLNLDLTSPVSIAHGGTNATSMATTDGTVYYDGTRLVTTATGTAGQVLTSNGAGVAPTYQAAGGGGGVTSITGDSGGAITGALTITGASTGALFDTTGTTITESFNFLALPDTNNPLTTGYISIGGAAVLAQYGTLGRSNIFTGSFCGNAAITGTQNTGDGSSALLSLSSGGNNTAIGCQAALGVTTGTDNTALGFNALSASTSGSFNIAIGSQAASNYTGAESNNIIIGTLGTAAESDVIRLGDFATQTKCYIAGAYGESVGGTNAALFMDNTGKIGTVGGSGGGGVSSITGDAGGAVTGAVSLTGGTSGAVFTGSGGNTLTTTFTKLVMSDTTSTTGYIQIGSQKVLACWGGVASNNIFVGQGAGHTTVSGTDNDGFGDLALSSVTSGAFNIAIGSSALQVATSSSSNVAVGLNVLSALTTGGGNNTAVGFVALGNITTGDNNIAIGSLAGDGYTTNETSNIAIGAQGTTGESHVIRIGTQGSGSGQQNVCFVAGIAGVTVSNSAAVLIDTTTGQLGTVISSRRFKENIEDIGAVSKNIYKLRPAKFNFKGDLHENYGLIAEDVEEIMPHLVSYDQKGLPATVKYHELPTLLLAEIQRLNDRLKSLEEQFAARVR